MELSIVIATRNRRDLLKRTLERLEQRFPRVPVIVVDNGSVDGSPHAARLAHRNVRVIALDSNAGSYARTIGAREAETPLLAFCDDDTCWRDDALDAAARIFEAHPKLGLLCGRLLIEPDLRLDPVCTLMENSPLPRDPLLPGPSIMGFLACAAVVRRDAFLEAGGFHPRYGIGGEEELLSVDLAARGWQLCYASQIVAHHAPATANRNPMNRRATQYRNAFWTAWLRRPARRAAQLTLAALRRGAYDRAAWKGFYDAVRGLPWVMKERRVVPGSLERRLCMLSRS